MIGQGHALVTGAAGAIGAAITRSLVHHGIARSVTLVDVDRPGAERVGASLAANSAQPNASRLSTRLISRVETWDLSEPASLPDRVRALEAEHGPVDVLVNCAGVMEIRSLVATEWATAARLLRIDLESPLVLMSLVAPGMSTRGAGAIVNVSSMAGVTPLRGCTYYGAAKAGLAMASEIARLELARAGVRVVTVYPGPVRSELERRARAQAPPTLATRLVPMGRPEPLGELVALAIAEDRARVVYPSFYSLASRFPRLAAAVTSRASPRPLDA